MTPRELHHTSHELTQLRHIGRPTYPTTTTKPTTTALLVRYQAGTGTPGPCPLCGQHQPARPLAILLAGRQLCRHCATLAGLNHIDRTLDAISHTRQADNLDPATQILTDAAWTWITQTLAHPRPLDPTDPHL